MRIALAIIGLAFTSSAALADQQVNKLANVSLDIPHDWKVTQEGPNEVLYLDPTNEAFVTLTVSEGADLKAVGDSMDAQLQKAATEIKWGGQEKVTLNGMSGVGIKGTAKVSDKPVKIAALILLSPNKHGVILFGMVQTAAEAKHKDQMKAIVNSLKPIK